jgi:EmrB/QacA subfamily drug resistance transporter
LPRESATRPAPGPPAEPPPDADAGRRRWTLIATIIGSSMTFVDATVVNIALPTIGRDLHAGLATQQWIMLAYSLAVASLYIVSGALGDRFGRRPVFAVGVGGFAVTSMLAGLAPSSGVLVAARILQGVTGAVLTTNSLALLRATFGAGSGRAVGLWTAWSGIGTIAGPTIGGLLVQYASWRWIFFLNVPPAALALVLAWAGRVREPAVDAPRPINVPASLCLAGTLAALTYALVEGARNGFASVAPWAGLAVAGLVAFVVSERRSANPLLPAALLRSRPFVVANLVTLLVYAGLGGSSFYLALYLQSAAVGYSPVRASLIFVPVSVVMFLLAGRFGRLADRDGPRRYLVAGPLLMAGGMLAFPLITDTNPLRAVPGVLLFALGLAVTVAPITSTALKAAPDRFSGLAAGVNTTTSRVGNLVATPLVGLVVSLVFEARSSHGQGNPFASTAATAGPRSATLAAFRAGMLLAAGLCIAGAVLAAREIDDG